jgi:hypothetical protein
MDRPQCQKAKQNDGVGSCLVCRGHADWSEDQRPTGNATHIFFVMLAPTGYGKDDPLQMGMALMDAAGARELLGPGEFASAPGFIKRLIRNPLMVCFVDELGEELKLIGSQKGNEWVTKTKSTLKKCYNSFGTIYTAEKAHEESQRIDWPAPSICGAATPQQFFTQLSSSDFEGGFANRFMIFPFEGFRRPPEQLVGSWKPPANLVKALKALPRQRWSFLDRPANGDGQGCPELDEVSWGDGAAELYLAFSRKMDTEQTDGRRYELAMRSTENAVRLATIVAVGRGLRRVEQEDIAWGIKLSEQSFEATVGGAARYVREYLDFPEVCDRLVEAFRKSGFVSTRDLNRKFGRHQKYAGLLDRALDQLIKESRIKFASSGKAQGYRYVEE